MESVGLEPTTLILIGTRTTYQATGDAVYPVPMQTRADVSHVVGAPSVTPMRRYVGLYGQTKDTSTTGKLADIACAIRSGPLPLYLPYCIW